MKNRLLQIAEYTKDIGSMVAIDLSKVEMVEARAPERGCIITLKANFVMVKEPYKEVKEAWINALTGDLGS
jgi:hypothetical protein